MTVQSLREFIDRHSASASALAGVAAVLDSRTSGVPLDPVVSARIHELLSALGAGDVLDDVPAEAAAVLPHLVRALLSIDGKLLRASGATRAWDYSSPEVLMAVGGFSREHARTLTRDVVPQLAGLPERLHARGGAFLDVGTGVGGLAIAMAQMWPELKIVGIDPWQPSLRLARESVDGANLAARIELREQGGESLDDRTAYDFAWVAHPFIPERVLPGIYARVLPALRPGGWMVIGGSGHAALPPLPRAAMGLKMALFGGAEWNADQAMTQLREAGYAEVHRVRAPEPLLDFVAGRRAS